MSMMLECSVKVYSSLYSFSNKIAFFSTITEFSDSGPRTVRLTGGATDAVGRIEVYSNSMWSPVCNYNDWDKNEALVVCRQLGYGGLVNTYPSNDFGMVSADQTGISGISCTGQEKELSDCDWTRNTTVSLPCMYVSAICSG